MKTERLLALLSLLQTRNRVTARQLSVALGVSERTVYRDLEDLISSGMPIRSFGGPGGGFFFDKDRRIRWELFSNEDLRALFLLSGKFPLEALGLDPSIPLTKLLASMPSKLRNDVDRWRQRYYFDPSNWFQAGGSSSSLNNLQQAIWEDRVVEVLYQSIGAEAKPRSLEAWALVVKVNVWYLVARPEDSKFKTLKTYRLSRIQSCKVTERRFNRDQDFDPERFWLRFARNFEEASGSSDPGCTAVLLVQDELTWYFPAYLEGRFRRREGSSRGGWVPFEVDFESEEAARMLLLGLGSYAEVVEPETLRQSVIRSALGILGRYGIGESVVDPLPRDPLKAKFPV